ncbi:LysR family transcriptional regulator [Pseudomonas sp. NPDC089554]|uniref:LysR family transcriptional regulator n=1 Tax=Pseudomonas sp. NPDC089554 TaxID=3390653 RepID=UPI003CFD0952
MDKLEAMQIFVEVVERGKLSAAAVHLNMPLPTLSRKLAELESQLGTRLLARSTRKLELTDAGLSYLQAAKQVLELVGDAERSAKGEYLIPKGDLLMTAPLTFGRIQLLPIINEFLNKHPQVNVKLALSDSRLDMISDHVDIAVRIGLLANSNLIARRIGDIRWVVVASPEFLDTHGEPRTPEELSSRACVGVDHLNLSTQWRFRHPQTGAAFNTPINARFAPSTAEVGVDAAIAGVGLTQVLHYQAAAAIKAGKLRVVLGAYEAEPLPIWLVYKEHALLPLKVRSFIDFAVPRLKQAIVFD